jgi:hypothetical protein
MEIKNTRPSHQDLKRKALENPEVKKEYERLKPFYEKMRRKIKKRIAEEKAEIQKSSD